MSVLLVLVIFLLLIFPHELGHFLVARICGMRVEKFSLGFGPKLWGIKKKGTEYLVSLFPLGGYVKIAGMAPGEQHVEDGFYSKPLSNKLAVILSGSAMNFLMSLLLFSFIFMIGFQTLDLESPIVGGVIDGSPAQEMGIKQGDRIVSINGQEIDKWGQIATFIQDKEEEELQFLILRDRTRLLFNIRPKYYPEYERKLIGISPSSQFFRSDPLTSFGLGAQRVVFLIGLIFRTLGGMVTGQVPAQFAGPVGMVQFVGEASELGIIPFFSLAAILGINLGLFNLFPIPALDGGRLIFLIIEGIRKKPVKVEFQEFIHYIGFLILILLMFLVTYQDILRLLR
ncbi:RIP metalloprotease RseP [Candidatus Aerophobetes bacterium]|nr:RIP metalloprotease RseP [Candidatus Aerophobetes bacterium]